jgi:hypothetical protein
MTIETISNTPDTLALGRSAWSSLQTAGKEMGKFNAKATYVLLQAYNTVLFECVVTPRSKDETPYVLSFGLDTFHAEYDKSSNVEKGAMICAVTSKLFGESDPTPNQRQSLLAVIKTSTALAEKLDDASEVTLSARGHLTIPYKIMHAEPAEDAKQSEINRYKAMKDTDLVLDEPQGDNSYAEMVRRLKPKTARGVAAPAVKHFVRPALVSFEARVDAMAFAIGNPTIAKKLVERLDEFDGMEDLKKFLDV